MILQVENFQVSNPALAVVEELKDIGRAESGQVQGDPKARVQIGNPFQEFLGREQQQLRNSRALMRFIGVMDIRVFGRLQETLDDRIGIQGIHNLQRVPYSESPLLIGSLIFRPQDLYRRLQVGEQMGRDEFCQMEKRRLPRADKGQKITLGQRGQIGRVNLIYHQPMSSIERI